MGSMKRKMVFVLVLLVTGLSWGQIGKYQFRVRDGALLRGMEPFTLRAIESPDLVGPEMSLGQLAVALNRMAEVGASAACFDLPPLREDGTLSKEDLERIGTAIGQMTWRRMGPICRIFGKDAPEDPAVRLRLTRSIAKSLKTLECANEAVYWIEGENVAELVSAFHRIAPDLTAAIHHQADLAAPILQPACKLVSGVIPNPPSNSVHFVMPPGEETYEAFDKVFADPIEFQPWTPDNSVLSEEERQEGWIALFDGKSLDGWVIVGQNKQGFVVRDGAIEWAGHGGGWIRTRDRYDSFILRLEWRISDGGNSGIFLHAPRTGRASKIGVEFQLRGQHSNVPTPDSTGAIYDVLPPLVDAGRPPGHWNQLEIQMSGRSLKAVLNGQVVQDIEFDANEELRHRLRRGFIGLQDHGRPVAFRNIRVRSLGDSRVASNNST